MTEKSTYQVQLHGADAKTGKLDSTQDGLPTLEVASPPEFGGPGGVWSPEHLFVAAISSCLMTTFRTLAAMSGVDIVSYEDDATGELVRGEDRLYRIETVTLRPRVVVANEFKLERAGRLLTKAEAVCLIGRSINTDVILEPAVISVGSH